MARPTHVVVFTVCGEPVPGVWCGHCGLPSALAQMMAVGTRLILIQQCMDCGVTRPIR